MQRQSSRDKGLGELTSPDRGGERAWVAFRHAYVAIDIYKHRKYYFKIRCRDDRPARITLGFGSVTQFLHRQAIKPRKSKES
jgi:hypothetical protein